MFVLVTYSFCWHLVTGQKLKTDPVKMCTKFEVTPSNLEPWSNGVIIGHVLSTFVRITTKHTVDFSRKLADSITFIISGVSILRKNKFLWFVKYYRDFLTQVTRTCKVAKRLVRVPGDLQAGMNVSLTQFP